MIVPKLQFQVKYTHIMSFKDIIRNELASYIKLADAFGISNENTYEEAIKFDFHTSQISVECTWDNILLTAEGVFENFNSNINQFEIFFKILESIKENKNFDRVKSFVYVLNAVKGNEKDNISIEQNKIMNNYINGNIGDLLPQWNDFALTIEKKKEDGFESVNLGPFDQSDIKKHDLLPFKSTQLIDELKNGQTMLQHRILTVTDEVNPKVIRDLLNKSASILEKI